MTNKKNYLKYLNRELALPAQETIDAIMNGPCDPEQALNPKDINLLFEPGYLPLENGWCHMPNHTAFIAVRTEMKGVTLDMLRWWFAWHVLEDERYQIWYPPCHYGVSVGDEDRAIILDPKTPPMERIYDKLHFVKEDVYGRGEPKDPFNIHFRNPIDMGFDPEKVAEDDNFAIFCAFPTLGKDVPNSGFVSSMAHFARKTDDGVELRSRFFQGYTFENRMPIAITTAEHPVPEKAPFMLAKHCAEEYAALAGFLPQIYAEEKDAWI